MPSATELQRRQILKSGALYEAWTHAVSHWALALFHRLLRSVALPGDDLIFYVFTLLVAHF